MEGPDEGVDDILQVTSFRFTSQLVLISTLGIVQPGIFTPTSI